MHISVGKQHGAERYRSVKVQTRHREAVALLTLLALAVLAALLVYRLPGDFSLDVGTPAAQPYIRGFASPEANEAYTYAFSTSEAEMILPSVGAGVHRLSIRMSGWRPAEAKTATARLAVSGRETGPFVVQPEPRIYHLLVSNAAPDMRLHWLGSMFVPGADDTRQLGVAVDTVTLHSVQTYPTPWQVGALLLFTLLAATLARRLLPHVLYAYGGAALVLVILVVLLAINRAWESYLLPLSLGLVALHIVLWLPALGRSVWQDVLPFPERLFIWVGGLSGLLCLFAAAPFTGPDEAHHLFRAYQVAAGDWIPYRNQQGDESGGMLPTSLDTLVFEEYWLRLYRNPDPEPQTIANLRALGQQELQPDVQVFVDFRGAALYSPMPYSAQAVGIALGRLFDLSPIWLLYLARLTNLAAALWLIFCAIKITPFFKWVLLFIGLTPTTIFQMATLSADSLTNSFAFLFVALVLFYAFGKTVQRLQWSDVLLLCLAGAAVALSKHMYFLLLLLFLLIPVGKLGGKMRYGIAFATFAAAFLLPLGAWSLIVQHWVFVPRYVPETGILPDQQTQFILSNPSGYLAVLLTTFSDTRPVHLAELFGRLGGVRLDTTLIIFHVLALVGLVLVDGRSSVRVAWWHKVLCLGITALSVCMIYTLGYIGWNVVAHPRVEGIQPRYFMPFLPLLCLLLYNRSLSLDIRRWYVHIALACYVIALMSWGAWHMLTTYY
jgi:uncharacterized membrane protein